MSHPHDDPPGPLDHDADLHCADVLDRMAFFIDNELAEADIAQIAEHIDACAPCLEGYDVERLMKALVARSCAEHAPAALRNRVMMQIRQVQITITE